MHLNKKYEYLCIILMQINVSNDNCAMSITQYYYIKNITFKTHVCNDVIP